MKIVCISDNHDQNLITKFGDIPDGDVLVHTGDLVGVGDKMSRFWRGAKNLRHLPHKRKIYVPGNHDRIAFDPIALVEIRRIFAMYNIDILFDERMEIDGISFYGSGWLEPKVGMPGEYGGDFHELWDKVEPVDVLLTHQPPSSIMDWSDAHGGEHIGSSVIYWKVFNDIRPMIHVFGHNHSAHGEKEIDNIKFINASLVNDEYQPEYQPIVVEINK